MSHPGFRPDGSLDPAYTSRIQQNNAHQTSSRSIGSRPDQYAAPYYHQQPYPVPQPQHPYPPYQQQQQPQQHPYPPGVYPPYQQSHYQPPPPPHPHGPPVQQPRYSAQYRPAQGYQPAPHYQHPPPPPPPPSQQPYSNQPVMSSFRPTGRKRALLVGINYRGTSAELKGCVRDVTFVHHLLVTKFGFKNKDFVVLTDESTGISGVRKGPPTRKVILDSLKWLVGDSKPGDSLWFSFSGHGSQVRDKDGDESDGWDETILPVDYKRAGQIVDDELYAIVKRVAKGARLTVLLDACHSGTGLDLPYQHDIYGGRNSQRISQGGRPQSLAGGLFGVANALLSGNTSGAISAGINLATGQHRKKKRPPTVPDPNAGEVLLFAGCKDSQTSADTTKMTGGLTTGAMTYALIETLERSSVSDWRNYTYRQMLQTMSTKLKQAKMSQIPQFSTSHPFDLNSRFRL